MKVAIVSFYYKKKIDIMYQYFKEKNFDVDVYTTNFNHTSKEYETINQNYINIHAKRYKKNFSLKRFSVLNSWSKEVYKTLKDVKYDILYIIGPPNSLFSRILKYKKDNEKTLLYSAVMDLWPESFPFPSILKKIVKPLESLMIKRRNKVLSNYDLIFTECDYYKLKIDPSLGYHDKIITNYFPFDKLGDKKYNLSKNELNLLYLGSINHLIDINKTLEVLLLLKTKYKINFNIIGNGSNKDTLIELLKDNEIEVIDHGVIFDWNEKLNIMNQCDYGINIYKKSLEIGLTLKSIEYFAAGLPIISNIKGDTRRFIDEFKVGIDVTNEATNLFEIILNEKENLNMRENSIKLFNELLSVEAFKKIMNENLDKELFNK